MNHLLLAAAISIGISSVSAGGAVLGKKPEWSRLDAYHNSITSSTFEELLRKVYVPRESWWKDWIKIDEKEARIRKFAGKEDWYVLPFASCPGIAGKNRRQEYWRSAANLRAIAREKLLAGFHIALDPGHLGGKYSEMEGRHFVIGEAAAVKEGDLALLVAKRLSKHLSGLGAKVSLVRTRKKPVTKDTPKTLRKDAEAWQKKIEGDAVPTQTKKERKKLVRRRGEILFFRSSEIMARALKVNEKLKPDLVVCIHLNAAPWPNPEKNSLVERNDYHVLTNGAYLGGEIALDNQRLEMLVKLLNRSHKDELSLAECMAQSFKRATGLPAFNYKGPNAVKVGEVAGVWGRNLMANRLYECPVVFLEPYVANSKQVFARIQAGDYEGVKEVGGKSCVSLVEEYVDAVIAGLVAHAASHAN